MTPQHIGRYELHAKIGQGGMASIYQGYDPRFKRTVAIKLLPSALLADETFLARFEQEAQTVAALEHSAIVPVYDFGEHEGQPYLIMRYMAGGTLLDRIQQQGGLPLDETAHILERVAAALDWAHLRGVIHRDVKPSNILFDEAGDVYLGDFGIVKLTEATAQLTGSGIVGTPAYMAPEMMSPGGVTHLIDVYALGITLYEMLTGRLPFEADTPMGILMAHVASPVPDARVIRPDLPGDIQYVIDHSMAKNPAERYQKASDLATEVRQVVRDAERWEHDALPSPQPSLLPDEAVESPSLRIDSGPYEAPPAPETPPRDAGMAQKRGLSTWIWLVSAVAVVAAVIGALALSGVLKKDQLTEGEPTQIPVEPSTITPVPPVVHSSIVLAEQGVARNQDWTPYVQEINGVKMALVPAGCFMMGSEEGDSDESPVHEICFDEPFWIDVYEVTNGQYGETSSECLDWSWGNDQPRVCTDWFDSLAHCESRGARLPTEAEWEYAARGPDGLVYPWGNEFVADYVVYGDPGGRTAVVGSKSGGVSWVGAYDLIGNVEEWVSSLDDSYPYDPTDGREDSANVNSPDTRVVRGGSWLPYVSSPRAADRNGILAVQTPYRTGFRCALSYSP